MKHKIDRSKVAYIHQAPTGLWHVTADSLGRLDETGDGFYTESGAIRAARESGEFTHRISQAGRLVKLP